MKNTPAHKPLDFINRKKEQKLLLDYFNDTPKNILFLYGPKSSGKTTMIKRVLENLDDEKFDISFFNMREHLVLDFTSFRQLFFPPNLKEKAKEFLTQSKISLPGFSWNGDDEAMIAVDIFGTMKRKMEHLKSIGVQPIIVIDEFQYLRDITIYDPTSKKDVSLIEELFKFFIALTKQNNLAHVVCLTSDSYYMEELYNDAKLTNTSDFQLIEHLSQKDIEYWLGEKENCPKEMVTDIWENLGGSVWEIWQVFASYKNTGDWKPKLNDLLQVKFSYLAEYYDEDVTEKNREKFIDITRIMAQTGEYEISRGENIKEMIKELVARDFWFFDTKTRILTPNSKSFQIAMGKLIEEVK